jgi:hypothetical protein
MNKVLVRCRGWIGDILFASSLAKKLHEENEGEVVVDYYIPLPQPQILLEMNPYISEIFNEFTFNPNSYTRIIDIPAVNQQFPATWQFQKAAGIRNPTNEFPVWTVDTYDDEATKMLMRLRENGKPIVAWQSNWWEKSYIFTEEQYNAGVDKGQGFGDGHRDIQKILSILEEHVNLVEVGLPAKYTQHSAEAKNPYLYAFTASAIKQCDWMIGGESGLTNLSAAVGTPTIITTDFIWQQYGPKGNFHKLRRPAMGPVTYFPEGGHVHLRPFLTDLEVAHAILDCILQPGGTEAQGAWWHE